jgi:L-lysine 6-transaminase
MIGKTFMSVIERETRRMAQAAASPVVNMMRNSAFTKTEAAGTDLSGSWAETNVRRSDVDAYQESSKIHTLIDNHQSKGSHVVDVDGNVLLDLCSTESLPLGHNPDCATVSVATSQKHLDSALINGSLDGSERSGADAGDVAQAIFEKIAPKGLQAVTLARGSNAVEQAIFAAMQERGSDPRFSAMGFTGSHHGNSLALTQFAHPQMSLDLGWPSVAYPESAAQEAQVLDSIKETLAAKRSADSPVAAIVIEPTNAQSGHVASDSFMNELVSLAREAEAALIVDEAGTGCGASGEGFWQYNGAADYVTFGKRTQVAGYFSKDNGSSSISLAGSRLGLLQLKTITEQIEGKKLIEQVKSVGDSMRSQAVRAAEKSGRISGVRGSGTMLWIDTKSTQDTLDLYRFLREQGALVKLNGGRGVMTKPALTLRED